MPYMYIYMCIYRSPIVINVWTVRKDCEHVVVDDCKAPLMVCAGNVMEGLSGPAYVIRRRSPSW